MTMFKAEDPPSLGEGWGQEANVAAAVVVIASCWIFLFVAMEIT